MLDYINIYLIPKGSGQAVLAIATRHPSSSGGLNWKVLIWGGAHICRPAIIILACTIRTYFMCEVYTFDAVSTDYTNMSCVSPFFFRRFIFCCCKVLHVKRNNSACSITDTSLISNWRVLACCCSH